MRYYDTHESVYKNLQSAGKQSWSDRPGGEGAHAEGKNLRSILDELFTKITFPESPLDALDLGCGTGPFSAYLAARGFRTLGIDVSPTAIEMARSLAAQNKLEHARFEVIDIVRFPDLTPRFDLIVDAMCLHCIVFDEDRAAALGNIARLLKPGGLFAVCTKTTGGNMDFGEKFHLDDQGVLWFRTGNKIADESVERDGAWHMPQRRINSPEKLQSELQAAGFELLWNWEREGVFGAVCRLSR